MLKLAVIAALNVLSGVTVSGQATNPKWCGTNEQRESIQRHIHYVMSVVDSTGISINAREDIGQAVTVTIIPVTDEAICERAARIYYRHHLGPFPPVGIGVVRFGDRYGVLGTLHGGEWATLIVYNSRFEPIGVYGV